MRRERIDIEESEIIDMRTTEQQEEREFVLDKIVENIKRMQDGDWEVQCDEFAYGYHW